MRAKGILGIAITAVVVVLGLGASTAPAATCDTWTNAAGGAWETGANWSTNAPPASGEYACIATALSAPVVLNSSPTVAGLTLGGSGGTAELEVNGSRTLTLGGDSTIADTGMLTNENGALTIQQTGTLTNNGTIVPASSGLHVAAGTLANAADGAILDSSTSLYVDGPGTLTNNGELSLTGSAALVAPFNGGTGATVVNAGRIENTSSSHSSIGAGATLEQTSGATTGTPVQINGGTLDLEGAGNSSYQMVGTSTLTGTVAAAQTIILDGNISTTGSLTNNGTLTGFQGPALTIPNGGTLTNNGVISLPGLNLNMAGNVHNDASGKISISGGTLALQGAVTLTNDGTIAVAPNSLLTTTGSSGTFATVDNDGGTIANGGDIKVAAGGTFVEGAGTETGDMIYITGGTLQLTGAGASQFELVGSPTVEGDIAADQTVENNASSNWAGNTTNAGTLLLKGGKITLPTGDTLTNDGLIAGSDGVQLYGGNLTNAADGTVDLQAVLDLSSSNQTITNNGTMLMPCCGGVHLDNSGTASNTFANNGTYYNGTLPTGSSVSWGGGMPLTNSNIQASATGDVVTMNGTVVPLPSGAEMPAPPVSPSSSWYQFINAPGTNPPPVWTLSCGFSVAVSNWAGSCSDAEGGRLTIASNTTLDPTITTVIGSGTCNGQNTCSSTYGQPVTVTATVSAQYGPSATGTVTLLAEETHTAAPDETVPYVLGTVPLSTTAGVTTGSVTTQLPPGQIQLSAIYNGDSSSLMSAAMFQPYVVQNVAQPTASITALNSSASAVFGAPVTLTATVTPSQTGGADPTGSVRFGVGGSQFALGEAPVVTVGGVTTATLTTTALAVGANTVYAAYSGDYNFGPSSLTSTTVTEAMPAAPTHVSVTGGSTVAAGTTYSASASTDGTGAILYALAASPAPPAGMTIGSAGHITFHVPATGLAAFAYVVVASNAAGRAVSTPVSVTVTRAVTVSKLGAGSGTVTSSPAGINCGSTCSAHFASGASVTLTAVAAAGSTFVGWSGGGCSGTGTCHLTVSADMNVVANFKPAPPNTKVAAATIKPKNRTAMFTFTAVGVATGFQCALARKGTPLAFTSCASPARYTHLRLGTYTFAVRAVNKTAADPTPAKRKFTISG